MSKVAAKSKVAKTLIELMREHHRRTHPNCTYGDEPHYVPPSAGCRGMFLCEIPVVCERHRLISPSEPSCPQCREEAE